MFSQGGASGQRKDEESGKINYEICCSPVSIQDHALLLQIKEMLYKWWFDHIISGRSSSEDGQPQHRWLSPSHGKKDDIMVIISNRALQWWTNIIMSIWPMSDVFAIFTPPWYVFHKCEYLYRFYLYLPPWSVFEKCELEKQVGHFCYFFSPRVKLITTNFEKHLDSEITGTYSSANLTSQY